MSPNPSPALRRELGLLDAIGIGLGAIIGAGIFVVTGVAAGVAGPAFLVSLAVAGAAATCNGLSSAQLAALYPQSGGTYEYGYRVLNPAAGFAAGWMFLASKLAAAGTVALGFGHYGASLLPGVAPVMAAAVAVILVTLANVAGIQKTGKLNLVIVALTLTSLVCFVGFGAGTVRTAHFTPFAPNGWRGVAEASALLFFAYTGYARLATLGEEVREPERNIPRAIVTTLWISMVLYLAVGVVAVGNVGAAGLGGSRAPLELAAEAFTVPGISRVMIAGAATAMLGVLLSQVLGISRMMLAMSRRGDLPAFLSKIDERRGIPLRAICLTGSIALLLALTGRLEFVLAAAAFTILIYYSITNVAALRLPATNRRYPAWVAWCGLATCLLMAFSMQLPTILSGAGLLLAGFLFRLALTKFRSRS
jgi:basic amino acid/polyamine antiporter, APA family